MCVGSSYRTSGKDLKSTGNTLYPIKIRSTVTRIIHMWKTRVKTANTKLDVIVNDTHDGCHMWNRNCLPPEFNPEDLAWRFAMKYENRTVRPIITKTPPQKFNGAIIDRVEMIF
jgi:hypothetical protein